MVNVQRLLVTFGTGADGRLGHGFPTISQALPRVVASLAGYPIKQVSCGGAHTAAVADDGTLFTFGLNEKGQLGHSRGDKFVAAPLEVTLPDPVASVAAGDQHTLALTSAGEVWSWGAAGEGALGIGHPKELRQVEPRLVRGLEGCKVTAVAAGAMHSMALTASGEVLTWGRGDFGALGHDPVGGCLGSEYTPRRVRALGGSRLRTILAGPFSSGAVDAAGATFTWGHGAYWQLGTGGTRHEPLPVKVSALRGVRGLSLGQLHSLAVDGDGRLMVWGTDEHGSLGQSLEVLRERSVQQPRRLASTPSSGWVAVAAGWKHSLALDREGRLFSWGWSGAAGAMGGVQDYGGGQLGHGDDEDRWAPEQVLRMHTSASKFYDLRMSYIKPWRVLQVAAGRNHSAAVVETEIDFRDLAG